MPAMGTSAVEAMIWKPSGSATTIAVAHPDVEQPMTLGIHSVLDTAQQGRVTARPDLGVTKFVHRARLDATAELGRHRLHAVADTEHRHAERKHRRWGDRRIFLRDRLWTAREDDALGREGTNVFIPGVPRMDFAIDAEFAYPTRNELGVLRTEIEDQDPIGMDVASGHR